MGIFNFDGDNIKDCTCKYCGYVGKPYMFDQVYECIDYTKKLRMLRFVCPKCKVLDSIKER